MGKVSGNAMPKIGPIKSNGKPTVLKIVQTRLKKTPIKHSVGPIKSSAKKMHKAVALLETRLLSVVLMLNDEMKPLVVRLATGMLSLPGNPATRVQLYALIGVATQLEHTSGRIAGTTAGTPNIDVLCVGTTVFSCTVQMCTIIIGFAEATIKRPLLSLCPVVRLTGMAPSVWA
jgi:hypothetical protein